jgi:hypothetical protein
MNTRLSTIRFACRRVGNIIDSLEIRDTIDENVILLPKTTIGDSTERFSEGKIFLRQIELKD